MRIKPGIYKVDNGSDFDVIHFETEDNMVTVEGRTNLGKELKRIPRFDQPNFTFNISIGKNKAVELRHNLGYIPKLFCFSTTIGNVNPTFQLGDKNIVRFYNYSPNDCGVVGYIW